MRELDQTLKPLAGVAIRTDVQTQDGKVFCTLPLPITSNLPFHVNGFFCMTSDRRSIALETHAGIVDFKIQWNKLLLTELV